MTGPDLVPVSPRLTDMLVSAVLGLVALALAQPPAPAGTPPRTVPRVDLDRYAGRWFELARYPNRFQRKCTGNVVAQYTRTDDGRIRVVNRCTLADGSVSEAAGVARLASDDGSNAKLKVRFAPAFLSFIPAVWGDYWILGLADDYSYAVVGDPDRQYLWFLSRTASVSDETYRRLVEIARSQGFDPARIERTPQSGSASGDRQPSSGGARE